MAVVSIFNAVNLGTFNLNTAFASASSMSLQSGANTTINGRSYSDLFEIDFMVGGLKYQDLLVGTGLVVNSANVITSGTIMGLIENVSDGINWVPNWMIQDISTPAATLFQAYQTSSNADDLAVIATALKGDDIISGSTNGPDTILAGDGNDVIFIGGTGGNVIDGGNGFDTVIFASPLTDHTVVKGVDGSIQIIGTLTGGGPTDKLTNVEQVVFSDYTLNFDLTSAQDAMVYRLYQAAFARTPDNAGFRFWAALSDRTQISAVALSDQFLAAPEFAQKYGIPDNTGFATAMYTNVLGRTPDAGGLSFWIDQLNKGLPRDQLLVAFANSAENIQLTGAHMSNGYWTT